MKTRVAGILRGVGDVLALCPECGQLFYLSEAGLHLEGKRPHSIVDVLAATERRLERDEEQLLEIERELRDKAAKAGLRITKKLLKKIDPMFSGSGYDPQDVKVIFDPVTYVIFHGMSENSLEEIVLMATPPQDGATERLHQSIGKSIKSGNLEFKTLHVDDEGRVASR